MLKDLTGAIWLQYELVYSGNFDKSKLRTEKKRVSHLHVYILTTILFSVKKFLINSPKQ